MSLNPEMALPSEQVVFRSLGGSLAWFHSLPSIDGYPNSEYVLWVINETQDLGFPFIHPKRVDIGFIGVEFPHWEGAL